MSYHSRINKALTGLVVLGLVASFSKIACTPATPHTVEPQPEPVTTLAPSMTMDQIDACLQPLGIAFTRSTEMASFHGVKSF